MNVYDTANKLATELRTSEENLLSLWETGL